MKHIKNLIFLLVGFLIISASFDVNAYASTPPDVAGSGVVLMDASNGQILFNKNMDEKLPPASTTKVMTALLTLEKTSLTDKVTIGKVPACADGTALGLEEGEVMTVEDLLNALIIGSCNDAAEALAEYISGSIPEFTNLMNKRADELGAVNTHFVNPSGLYDKNHYTSAKDLSLILRELLKHKEFEDIAQKPNYRILPNEKVKTERWVTNRLTILSKNSSTYYPYCIGGKTGYTIDAKHSFISAARKDGVTLISAIIHTDDKAKYFEDGVKLFEYGFNNFKLTKFLSKGDELTSKNINSTNVPLLSSTDFYYLENVDKKNTPKIKFKNTNLDKIDFKKDDVVSNATIALDDDKIGEISLVSGLDKPEKNIIESSNIDSRIVMAFALLISLTLIFITMIIERTKRTRVK